MQFYPYNLSKTPLVVRAIIWITALVSLLSPLLSFLLARYLHMSGPTLWLSLNLEGLKMGWLWQPFTYFFLQSASLSFSLSLLFSLFFNMLLFWYAAKEITLRFSPKIMLGLYLGGGLFAGLLATAALFFFSTPSPLVGSGPALFALLVGWSSLQNETILSLMFFWKIGARVIVLILLGITLLSHLIHLEWLNLIATSAGALYGYLFSLIAFKPPKKKRSVKQDDEIEVEVTVVGKEEPDEK